MKRKLTLAATAIALVVLAGSGYLALQISGGVPIIGNPLGIALARPAVVQGEGSFLEDEAGITAYTDTGFTIDLDNARDAFRTVEQETATYLIGSVAVPGFPDSEDAHVFVNVNGWIVAYYDQGSPVARVVQWVSHPNPGPHKLEQVIAIVAGSAGVPVLNLGFYDFRYPNANEWLLIIDNDAFEVTIPSEFLVFERSFSHYVTGGSHSHYSSKLRIDGATIYSFGNSQSGTAYGDISATKLLPGVPHNIDTVDVGKSGSVAISLTYRTP